MPSLTEGEARRRLTGARSACLATVSAAGVPHIVPITFAVAGEVAYSAVDAKPKRSPRLQRLANIAANPAVSVLADEWDEDWTRLWWVRGDGRGRVIDDGPERVDAVDALRAKYPQYADHALDEAVIAVDIVRVTGWAANP